MDKYRHYKGAVYELICVATHSETYQKLVIYKNKEGNIFARPYDMFFEYIEINGEKIQRFEKIK